MAARAEAEALRRRLLEGDAMRRAAAWLDDRPQLGRELFGRGVGSNERQASARLGDIADLFRACLVALVLPELAEGYRPSLPPFWRVQDALARITRLLDTGVEGELGAFLPRIERHGPGYDLRCRAAVASTLVAGLELVRASAARVDQNGPSKPVWLAPAVATVE